MARMVLVVLLVPCFLGLAGGGIALEFDGVWVGAAISETPVDPWGDPCPSAQFTMTITNHQITGTAVDEWGFVYTMTGSVDSSGQITAGLATGGGGVATFDGSLSGTALCLNQGRFRVEVAWRSHDGTTGDGQAVSLSGDTGYFWFFTASNVELVVNVLDGRWLNGHFWVFYGALSDVAYTITVTDTDTGAVREYVNPPRTFASVADTEAFGG